VQAAARLSGNAGLHAVIANTSDEYVRDATPNALSAYHARFRFDPNTVAMGTKLHDLFEARDAGGRVVLRAQLQHVSSGYQLRLGILLNSGTVKYGPWTTISDAPHIVESGWRAAATASGSTGSAQLWIDGAAGAPITGLANGGTRIDEARLGPQQVALGVSGTEFFDDFISTGGSYIG
jgi:hypothetical protein